MIPSRFNVLLHHFNNNNNNNNNPICKAPECQKTSVALSVCPCEIFSIFVDLQWLNGTFYVTLF